MNSPINSLPPLELCYHYPSQTYWIPDNSGKWIRISEKSAERYLFLNGYSDEVKKMLLQVQQGQNVGYAAKLAGYDAGYHDINGAKVLVTESPKLIQPKAGDWTLLSGILDGMLNLEEIDQRPYSFGWLKGSLASLHQRKWTQAQVLAFAGPRNSAKSLLQDIITEMLGGRSAKPYLFLTGRTNFNAEMFQGEHLMVEDECEYTDIKSRRHFGSQIKQIAVNRTQHCHGKNKDGLILTPWWRMTITLNDDPERMLVLPQIEDDIEDKIMLFKVVKREMPMPTETSDQKELFRAALRNELPAFIAFLLEYKIPDELRCPRFGVKHFHHPDILLALDENSAEVRLLELIDKQIFGVNAFGYVSAARKFSALDLEAELTNDDSSVAREARKLLYYDKACGSYLGRLAKKPNSRITKRLLHGTNQWTIQPPTQHEAEKPAVVAQGGWVDSFLTSSNRKNKDNESEPVRSNQCTMAEAQNLIHPSTPSGTESDNSYDKPEICIHPSTQSEGCPRPPACVRFAVVNPSLPRSKETGQFEITESEARLASRFITKEKQ